MNAWCCCAGITKVLMSVFAITFVMKRYLWAIMYSPAVNCLQ